MANYRNPKILALARYQECQLCHSRNGVVAAHSNQLRHGKGRGIKAHDCFVAYLCDLCHHQLDQGFMWSAVEKEQLWRCAHEKSVQIFKHLLTEDERLMLEADGFGWESLLK